MPISSQIMEFIEEELLLDDEAEIDGQTSLFKDRILDSLNLISLITFIEKTFKIKIDTSEVAYENLDTIDNMVAFINKKLA